jgi:hypothetical protein
MAISILKVAPTAVVVIVSGVCTWPYLWASGDDPAGPKAAMPTEISAALLDPAVGTNFNRNPFLVTEADQMALARIVFNRIKDRVVVWYKQHAPARDEVNDKGNAVGTVGADLNAEFVLNGTYLHPDRQLAMINGRVYAPGEALKGIDPARGRYVLAEVRPHSVVLTVRGKPQELTYPPLNSKPRDLATTGPAAVTAGQRGIAEGAPQRPSQRRPAAKSVGGGSNRTRGRGR